MGAKRKWEGCLKVGGQGMKLYLLVYILFFVVCILFCFVGHILFCCRCCCYCLHLVCFADCILFYPVVVYIYLAGFVLLIVILYFVLLFAIGLFY